MHTFTKTLFRFVGVTSGLYTSKMLGQVQLHKPDVVRYCHRASHPLIQVCSHSHPACTHK